MDGVNVGQPAEPHQDASRFVFDLVAALVLFLTALAGACAPLYLAGYNMIFGSSTGANGMGGMGGMGGVNEANGGANGRPALHPQAKRSMAFVVGNLFSAGVMVSAGLCHLLGEAIRDMNRIQLDQRIIEAEDAGIDAQTTLAKLTSSTFAHEFPWATFLCGCGLLVTLVADKFATVMSNRTNMDIPTCCSGGVPGGISRQLSGGAYSVEMYHRVGGSANSATSATLTTSTPGVGNGNHPIHVHGSDDEGEGEGEGGGTGAHLTGKRDASINIPDRDFVAAPMSPLSPSLVSHGYANGSKSKKTSVSFITAMLMGVALCFHSLLEGAALGAQETITNSLHIFIAIVSHKGLAAYALGSSLVESRVDMERFWKVIVPFTLASPAGIFLGFLLSELAQGMGAAAASALASGTFLFVAFMEVIPRELELEDYNVFLKLAALLAGFAAMSLLAIWA